VDATAEEPEQDENDGDANEHYGHHIIIRVARRLAGILAVVRLAVRTAVLQACNDDDDRWFLLAPPPPALFVVVAILEWSIIGFVGGLIMSY